MTRISRSRFLRPRTGAVVAAFALVAVACGAAATDDTASLATPTATRAGTPAPAVEFSLFDGSQSSLADFAGKPVVVNFWASWCPSCVAEMSAAFRPVQDHLGDAVTFVGMNIQDERPLALALLEETGVQWISAEDPDGELYRELGGIAMPFTVYVTSEGDVIEKHNGPLNETQLRQQIAEVFGA